MTVLDLVMGILTLVGLGIFPWPWRRRTTNVSWDIRMDGHRK